MIARRRTVLFVLPSLTGGGAEHVMVMLLQHLDRLLFEPHLALLEKTGPFLKEIPDDVPVYDLKTPRVRYAIPALIRIARRLRPDAVLSTLYELNLAMVLVKPLLPKESRLIVREAISPSAQLALASRYPRMFGWLYRRFYARADKIICVSNYVLNDLAEHFGAPREKMVTIYNSVDIDKVRRLADAVANPYPGLGPHFVAAGRLTLQKGFDLLLDAMAVVRRTLPLARLTILGEGPLDSDLQQQRERLGLTEVVRFIGFQSNPYPYLRHADLLVLSSRYEGMPNVVLEALALGTPVVAVDCSGGVKEILAGCMMGWLVPTSDARRLAETIILGLASRTASRPPEDLEEFLGKFRIERMIREYEDLLSL